MALLDIIILGFSWMLFIIFVLLALRTQHQRAMFKLALPFLARGKVLNLNFTQDKLVTFDLVELKENQLAKESLDSPEIFKNKDIKSGSAYMEPVSGRPVYVTVPGDPKTVDPAEGADPASMNDEFARRLLRLGERRAEYKLRKDERPQEIAGLTPTKLALIVVAILIGVVMAMVMNWMQLAEIGTALQTLGVQGG